MQKYLRNALIFLVLIFAVLGIGARVTNATEVLQSTNLILFGIACLFFILSILIWVISWSYLVKKQSKVGFLQSTVIGFSAAYGALTPVQVGADMLRSLWMKQKFSVPYSESISASMVVKGVKFLLIALVSSGLMLVFISTTSDLLLLAGLLSGFFVVALATALFLLPLKKSFGMRIASVFGKISKVIPPAKRLESFFKSYSNYLQQMGWGSFFLVALLAAFSLLLEFLALAFSFQAIALSIPLQSIAILFVLIAILERTPFLPRGIGLVEGIGFVYLSLPIVSASIAPAQIAALLIVFDFVRLVVPTIASILVHAISSMR